MRKSFQLCVVSYLPTTYHAAFYRALHECPRIEPLIIFTDRTSMRCAYEPEFGQYVEWNIDLSGFRHLFSLNFSPWSNLPLIRKFNPGVFFRIFFGQYDACLITGYSTLTALLALLAVKVRGGKALLREEAFLPADADASAASQSLRYYLRKFILRRFDGVMYSCNANKKYFLHFGVPDKKLFPLLSSTDIKCIQRYRNGAAQGRGECPQRWDVPQDALMIVFAGRFTTRKRPADLIEAFGRIANRYPEIRLVMVGNGPLSDELKYTCDCLGLAGRVHFPGFLQTSQLYDVLLTADIFVMPSDYDPSPKALNEAMAFGVPVVVSDGVGTAEDLVGKSAGGLVYRRGAIDSLADCLERFLSDPELRRRYGNAARRTSLDWSPEANARSVLEALDAL